jgi:2-polyprenyl-3-methyl-5-hydroxy-6-metoxy-1,4-benzoquinol methylase
MFPSWPLSTQSRRLQSELMDQPNLDVVTHQKALKALSRINRLSASHRILWPSIRAMACENPSVPLKVLDVACGGGDVTVRLQQTAQRAGLNIQVDGCDVSETAVALAVSQAQKLGTRCRFFRFDAIQHPWPSGYDVICCSLFLHHLSQDSALQWLRSAASAASRLVLVSDLVRSHWGYALAKVFSRLLTRSPIVRFDGPVSVAGAFTVAELQSLALQAGLQGAVIQRRWPARMLLEWQVPVSSVATRLKERSHSVSSVSHPMSEG